MTINTHWLLLGNCAGLRLSLLLVFNPQSLRSLIAGLSSASLLGHGHLRHCPLTTCLPSASQPVGNLSFIRDAACWPLVLHLPCCSLVAARWLVMASLSLLFVGLYPLAANLPSGLLLLPICL